MLARETLPGLRLTRLISLSGSIRGPCDVKLVTQIEAAMKLGVSSELLDYLRVKCPKKGNSSPQVDRSRWRDNVRRSGAAELSEVSQ